jgi:(2Fe-2S) ferredoxin
MDTSQDNKKTPSPPTTPQILVCKNRTCRKQGSSKILEAFRALETPGVEIVGCGCLGQCGNGPTVLCLPQQTWYQRVTVEEVSSIVEHPFTLSSLCVEHFEELEKEGLP